MNGEVKKVLSEKNYLALLKYHGGYRTGPRMTEEIRYFKSCDYICASSYKLSEDSDELCFNPTVWALTPCGEDALSEFELNRAKVEQQEAEKKAAEAKRLEERHEDHAVQKRQYTTQNKLAVIMPLVTFFLGLFLEYWTRILDRVFSSIFH